jgi:hypothetical protein
MAQSIWMYLAEAIAGTQCGRRPGAGHAMLIFVAGSSSINFDNQAIGAVEGRGWSMVKLKKSKMLDADLDLIEDDILREAAEHAASEGSAVVVYSAEVPHDS